MKIVFEKWKQKIKTENKNANQTHSNQVYTYLQTPGHDEKDMA